jgi:hypothetical protein
MGATGEFTEAACLNSRCHSEREPMKDASCIAYEQRNEAKSDKLGERQQDQATRDGGTAWRRHSRKSKSIEYCAACRVRLNFAGH